jgi:hypothetical protein
MAYIYINYTISHYHKQLITYVVSIGYYPLILRIPKLIKYNINLYFTRIDILFIGELPPLLYYNYLDPH